MLVSEDYPWSKLIREYVMYCAVGCINVAVMFLIYYWLEGMALVEGFPAASAWAIAYLVSTWQAHFLHRWLTFESPTGYTQSLIVMLVIYGILWLISTASIAYFSDILGYNHIIIFFINEAIFGFLSFLTLRWLAFPLSDGRITRSERLAEFKERRRA